MSDGHWVWTPFQLFPLISKRLLFYPTPTMLEFSRALCLTDVKSWDLGGPPQKQSQTRLSTINDFWDHATNAGEYFSLLTSLNEADILTMSPSIKRHTIPFCKRAQPAEFWFHAAFCHGKPQNENEVAQRRLAQLNLEEVRRERGRRWEERQVRGEEERTRVESTDAQVLNLLTLG